MPRFFTLSEAQELLPAVKPLIEEAVALKADYQQGEAALQSVSRRVTMAGGMHLDRTQLIQDKERRDKSAVRLKEAIENIHSLGCLIKDLDMGLIDFPTLFHGKEVYLCWKLGETGIQFWHGVDEGFRGRKPIDDDFLKHHRGEQHN